MKRASCVAVVCSSVLAAGAAGAQTVTPIFFGGAGDQRGSSIVFAPDGLYVAGSQPGLRGFANKYAVPPVTAPVWSLLAPSAPTAFDGLAVLAPNVFAVGGAFPPACGAIDGVGGIEWKVGLTRLQTSGTVTGCQSANFFPYSGTENYSGVVTQTEGATPFFYAVGYAENCGGNMLHVLAKYDAAGTMIGQVTEPGSAGCLGYAAGYAVTALNGSIYIAAHSQLTGAGEDNVPRPVLMKYDTVPARVWKRRDTTTPGISRGVAGIDGAVYVVGHAYAPGVPNSEQFMISKFDEAGVQAWSRISGGTGSDSLTGVVGIGGRVFAVGYTRSQGAGGADAVILEIDPATGLTLSTTLFGGALDDFANGAATDGTDLYVVGESRSFATPAGNVVGENDLVILRVVLPIVAAAPAALSVDASGNGVLQPNETVAVAPTWQNAGNQPITLTGAASAFTGPATATYTIVDGAAAYGPIPVGGSASCAATGDCYSVTIDAPNRPVLHWDATILETVAPTSTTRNWVLHVGDTFADVAPASAFYRFIETIVHKNVTGGCSGTSYCPGASTTRDQMAVFVLVAKEAVGYVPPSCGATPMFTDVPVTSGFCRWVEELARRGVVGGCGGGAYCPSAPATREQMAVFVLRTLDATLNPPACGAPMFADVPAASAFCRWIEELARRGVVSGCGGGNYCPGASVTREQMSVFLTVTFALALYGL